MGSITCIILTKNEEKNLPSALQNAASWADEILVVDSGSDDGTVEIAKKRCFCDLPGLGRGLCRPA